MTDTMPRMTRTKFHTLAIALGIVCAMQATSICALAEEPAQVPPPLFETRNFKEGDPDATTSKCIGNPITPLCAVDTWFAGSSYGKEELDDIAQGKRPPVTKFSTQPPYNPNLFCYKVVGFWFYQKEDRIYETQDFLKPGDVAFVVRWGLGERSTWGEGKHALGENQSPGECDLQPNGYPFLSFVLRQGQYGWYVYGNHHMIDFVHQPEPYPGIGK